MTSQFSIFISMKIVESALHNYTLSKSNIDLEMVMQRLAELTEKHYAAKGHDVKKKARALGNVFSTQLHIGKWPSVMQGHFDENFKIKVDAFLARLNNDCHHAAEMMVKQCYENLDRISGK